MTSRILILCSVLGFLLWMIFADYLRALWLTDRDLFWSTVSIAGFILLFSSFWMVLSARLNNIELYLKKDIDHPPCKACGSTAREYGASGMDAYCPHCGEPDSDFGW